MELNKSFNRNTIKLSYSCMPNMDALISGHNRKILAKANIKDNQHSAGSNYSILTPTSPIQLIPTSTSVQCNCRGRLVICPMEGKCLLKSIIYQADVKSDSSTAAIYWINIKFI